MNFVYLLDTNIISELIKANPDANVRMKVKSHQRISAIPSVVWSESLYGINVLPVSKKRSLLEDFYLNTILSTYPILPFDNHAASIFSDIKSRLHAIGRPAPVLDMQIASIAIANNMILVTRNVADFEIIQSVSALMLENWFTTPKPLHAFGIAHEYADPSKIPLEKTAWAEAVVEKYRNKAEEESD